MVARVFITGGGSPKMNVSPPGADAESGDAADMLFALSNRPTQIVQSGRVQVVPGSPVTVYWPEVLAEVPLVEFQTTFDVTFALVPYCAALGSEISACGISVEVDEEKAVFTATTTTRWVSYIALTEVYAG